MYRILAIPGFVYSTTAYNSWVQVAVMCERLSHCLLFNTSHNSFVPVPVVARSKA